MAYQSRSNGNYVLILKDAQGKTTSLRSPWDMNRPFWMPKRLVEWMEDAVKVIRSPRRHVWGLVQSCPLDQGLLSTALVALAQACRTPTEDRKRARLVEKLMPLMVQYRDPGR